MFKSSMILFCRPCKSWNYNNLKHEYQSIITINDLDISASSVFLLLNHHLLLSVLCNVHLLLLVFFQFFRLVFRILKGLINWMDLGACSNWSKVRVTFRDNLNKVLLLLLWFSFFSSLNEEQTKQHYWQVHHCVDNQSDVQDHREAIQE